MVWLYSRRSNKCTLKSLYRYFTCVTRGVTLFIFQGNFFMILDLLFSRLEYITFKTKLIYRYSKCFTRSIIGGETRINRRDYIAGFPVANAKNKPRNRKRYYLCDLRTMQRIRSNKNLNFLCVVF